MTSAYGWLILSSEATRLASEATRAVYTKIWEFVSHGLAYHKAFYTMHPSQNWWDKGVNASGNAHPADKVKAEANRFDLFPHVWRLATADKKKSEELFPGVTLWGVSQLFPGRGWNSKLHRREASFGSFSQLLVAFFLPLNGVQLTLKLSKINCKWKILIHVKRKHVNFEFMPQSCIHKH